MAFSSGQPINRGCQGAYTISILLKYQIRLSSLGAIASDPKKSLPARFSRGK